MSDSTQSEISALLMRHRTQLLGFILASVRDYHDAEDILQEVCLVACRRAREFRPGSSFPAWVRAIAARIMLSFHRRKGRRLTVDPRVIEGLERGAEQREREHRVVTERLRAMNQCLEKLAPGVRRLLDFRYRDGLSIEAIAERAGRGVAAVYKSLLRTRLSLRECIERRTMR